MFAAQVLYQFDFDSHGYNTTKLFNSRFGKIPQILGGEAPLWTEKVIHQKTKVKKKLK